MRNVWSMLVIGIVAVSALLCGTGCSGMKNGSMANVQPVTNNQRVGSVYLLRGWIGVFSTGIDSLGAKIDKQGVHAEVFQEAQWSSLANAIIKRYENQPNHEPIVIIGHSYGADDAILVSRKLAEKNIKVELVVTLDPVTPRKAPANIQLAYNLYQSGALDGLPFLRGIALTPEHPGPVVLKNLNIRKDRKDLLDSGLDHFNIEKKEKVHQDVIAQVLNVCQPRTQWLSARANRMQVAAAAPAVEESTPGGGTTEQPADAKPAAVKAADLKPADEYNYQLERQLLCRKSRVQSELIVAEECDASH